MAIKSRTPQLDEHESAVCLGIPVFWQDQVQCIVQLIASREDGDSGVFEIWKPSGTYQDLQLAAGYFGHLERFENVSSFVRFEQNAGLPGQAASSGSAVVHDDLKNHPGFLRAAGASAGELQTAIALPLFRPEFHASVLLISSQVTPIAKYIEVWKPSDAKSFTLEQTGSPMATIPSGACDLGTSLSAESGVISQVLSSQSAVLCETSDDLNAGRDSGTPSDRCLAIPTYSGEQLNNLALVWL
ncbi:MAG: GAF domain-containing protein [Planctomycetota bacterium]